MQEPSIRMFLSLLLYFLNDHARVYFKVASMLRRVVNVSCAFNAEKMMLRVYQSSNVMSSKIAMTEDKCAVTVLSPQRVPS